MHPSSPPSSTPSSSSAPSPGRSGSRRALTAGAVSFLAVFVLIVGGALGVRAALGGSDDPTPSPSAGPSDGGGSQSPSASASVEPERCWTSPDESKRTSQNSGRTLRGGGLEFTAPDGFDQRQTSTPLPFTEDTQMALATVERNWYSTITVGKLRWQDGVEYPGAEVASGRLMDCLLSNSGIWGGTSQRTLEHRSTTKVTIDGMDGFRTTGDLMFGQSDLEKVTGEKITMIVVDTPEGPSFFASEAAIDIDEHVKAAQEAEDSLAGVG
ncbi:hypothetical protein I8D64_14335 [Brachybacterium sp. MASK1Z-5]|uniref:Uncharacterized protein n=1 Tax=Brachybacterium halotolerans TaxID=2795215 RepID=A0ABS1BEY2_9MICO|nr:hypothetical protein [Brachybacterium halotolerans]MBK0332575.1 hypothetical protein [Brachybacterium halotolerans]